MAFRFIALWYIGITSDFGSEKPCSIHGGATMRLDNLCANTVSCQVPFRRCVLGDPLIGPGERSDTPSIRVQISASQQKIQIDNLVDEWSNSATVLQQFVKHVVVFVE